MATAQFISNPGKTFTVQPYNVATGAAIGSPLACTEFAPGIYRATVALTGIVYFVASIASGNLKAIGYWNLDRPNSNSVCEPSDRYQDDTIKLGETLAWSDDDESYNVTIDRPS